MIEYAIFKINLIISRQMAEFTEIEPDKPAEGYSQYYFGKLFGQTGSTLSRLQRKKKGTGEVDVPNCILRNENDVILLRIHNMQDVEIVEPASDQAKATDDYVMRLEHSYPKSYVIIDNRAERCQLAIEKSATWDNKYDVVQHFLEKYFNAFMQAKYGIEVKIQPKMEPTKFDEFVDKRLVKENDRIKSFTFECPNTKRCVNANIPTSMTDIVSRMSSIYDLYDAVSGKVDFNMGNNNVKTEKLYQLASVVTMCCQNGFDISVDFETYGRYNFNESIQAVYEFSELAIAHYKDFVAPELDSSAFDLTMRLEEIYELTKQYEDGIKIPTKPKGKNKK